MKSDAQQRYWLAKLTKLNPATGRGHCFGKAPHKPLLLLCLLDMAGSGELPSRCFARSAGLVLRFRSCGSLVTDRWPTRLDIRLPFFHLHNQGFWQALDSGMRPAASPESCTLCEMHPEFFELLANPDFRLKARIILISKYFSPAEQPALLESFGIQSDSHAAAPNRLMEEAEAVARRKGRCARFAVRVCSEYRYTCALTGYCCMTGEGATIVDAAHIEQWATTQNDDPANGLALSKNAHWMFDNGLWSADDELRIIVNPHLFTECGPEVLHLRQFAGRHLQIHPGTTLRPSIACFRNHRLRFGFPAAARQP